MFGGPVNSGLTFTKVLSGISKTLGVANQVIPLYREAKPMINNARTILAVLKGFNGKGSTTSNNSNNISTNTKMEEVPKRVQSSGPNFFL